MITYKDLEWELKKIVYDFKSCERGSYLRKYHLPYDKSLERIRKKGGLDARHPYPWEIFDVIIDRIEGKTSKYLDAAGYFEYCEWLSMAFERKGNNIIIYLDPENLLGIETKYINVIDYEVNGEKLKYSSEYVFNINGIKSEEWVDSRELGDKFFRFMYGHSFEDLPEKYYTKDKNFLTGRFQALTRELDGLDGKVIDSVPITYFQEKFDRLTGRNFF